MVATIEPFHSARYIESKNPFCYFRGEVKAKKFSRTFLYMGLSLVKPQNAVNSLL